MMDINKMSVREFRLLGYLQELNRKFLHPLGLALEVEINEETGEERFGGIWDYRSDYVGMLYGDAPELHASRLAKAKYVEECQKRMHRNRKARLGYVIQPLEKEKEDG